MPTLEIKVAAFLVTSLNVIFLLPTTPQVNVTIPVNNQSLTESPLEPTSLFPFLTSLAESLTTNACLPDLSSMNLVEKPEGFLNCTEEIAGLINKTHPDTEKTTGQIIEYYGYPLEEFHKVVTEDGYKLGLHRIPNPGRPPVFLQHGLGGCSDNWIFQYRNKSLAFLLYEHGYDVWLGNFRGTTYSLEHTRLRWDNPFDFSYWDFSFHEMSVYDVPAMIDYVVMATGTPKVFYIGHSMGTTSYLVSLDQVPRLNDKLIAGILLAPAGFVSRTPSPFRALGKLMHNMPTYLEPAFKGRFERTDKVFQAMDSTLANICTPTAVRCMACDRYIFSLYGIDAPQTNYTNIPNILAKFPNIISVKSTFHFAQLVESCSFRQFDYGTLKNLKVYKSPTPPSYTLQNVTTPTYAFHGKFDNMCHPKDVKRTLDLLPEGTLKSNTLVNSPYFNHIDFLLAKDAQTLVYTQILDILKEYQV